MSAKEATYEKRYILNLNIILLNEVQGDAELLSGWRLSELWLPHWEVLTGTGHEGSFWDEGNFYILIWGIGPWLYTCVKIYT